MKTSPTSSRSTGRIARGRALGTLVVSGLVLIFWFAGADGTNRVHRFARSALPAVLVASH